MVMQYCDTIWQFSILLPHFKLAFSSTGYAKLNFCYLSGGQEAILNVNTEV